jgi:hypothetical protein
VNAKGYLPILLTHHLVEFFLFVARFIPFLAFYIARYVAWMESAPKVVIGESGSILRTDCRVRVSLPLTHSYLTDHFRNPNLSPSHTLAFRRTVRAAHHRMGYSLRANKGMPDSSPRVARKRAVHDQRHLSTLPNRAPIFSAR